MSSFVPAFLVGIGNWSTKIVNFSPSASVSKFIGDAYRPVGWGRLSDQDAKDSLYMKSLSNISEIQTQEESDVEYGYFFDAFIIESHTGTVRITEHPVQSGANISDHAYNLPDRLSLQIFVSDSMECVVSNQFSQYSTKSVSAYQVLRELKRKRKPLSVRTKLQYYTNMLIESMTVNDDFKSAHNLRCTVMLREVMVADVKSQTIIAEEKHVQTPEEKGAGVATPVEGGQVAKATQTPAAQPVP